MKFTSQACTTKEQSERLLALGLKKETADCVAMSLVPIDSVIWTEDPMRIIEALDSKKIPNYPAWSLHRLIELYKDVEDTSMWSLDCITYNRLIQCISLAIKHGAFNKDYLEEKQCVK